MTSRRNPIATAFGATHFTDLTPSRTFSGIGSLGYAAEETPRPLADVAESSDEKSE
jgi:hypothetical protein